jgi:hypothetical protein
VGSISTVFALSGNKRYQEDASFECVILMMFEYRNRRMASRLAYEL